MRYIAQPTWNQTLSSSVVNFYRLSDYALITTIQLPHIGANSVVLYQNDDPSANVWYMFVAYDTGNGEGYVDVFDFSTIGDSIDGNPQSTYKPIPLQTFHFPTDPAVGMAIQPGTWDLYVATQNVNGGDSTVGVFGYTRASGYLPGSQFQFSSFDDAWNDAGQCCANLAFDLHGNLWMTTFGRDTHGNVYQYLICYTKVDSNPGSSSQFFKIANGTATTSPTPLPASTPGFQTTPGAPVFPFSQPEGIAFDPEGNLWLANNNDDYPTNANGDGTLLRISQEWIAGNLLNYTSLQQPLTPDGYGGTQSINSGDAGVTVYYLYDAKFGGLSFDGYTLYAHDQNQGYDPSNEVVWQWDTTPDPATSLPNPMNFQATGIVTTYPGNGTSAIFDTTPAALGIRDVYPGDIGQEPDTPATENNNVPWESVDIGVTQESIIGTLPSGAPAGSAPVLSTDAAIKAGEDLYVQVCVTNWGTTRPTTGKEVLKLYWGKASSALDWPAPFDGLAWDTQAPNNPPVPPVYGGFIGAQPLLNIAPGQEAFFEFLWPAKNVPNSSGYSIDDGHFCLLARIESGSLYPFGMSYPEKTLQTSSEPDLYYNVVQNSKIAWRNIHIEGSLGDDIYRPKIKFPLRLGVIGANYSPRAGSFRFALQTLGRDGKPAPVKGEVVVRASGAALERLRETRFENHVFHYIGDGRFRMHDPARGIENVRLHPGETLPFHVEFTPSEGIRDFAVRVVQYVYSGGVPKVVGGQTFVVGEVDGFPTRKIRRERRRPGAF